MPKRPDLRFEREQLEILLGLERAQARGRDATNDLDALERDRMRFYGTEEQQREAAQRVREHDAGAAGRFERDRQRQQAIIDRLRREERQYRLLQLVVPLVILTASMVAVAIVLGVAMNEAVTMLLFGVGSILIALAIHFGLMLVSYISERRARKAHE